MATKKSIEELLEQIIERLDRLEYAVVSRIFPEPISSRAGNVKWYAPYGGSWYNREPMSVPARRRVKLVDFKGAGRVDYLILMVKMPDDTPPDVEFVVTVDGFEVEDWTIYEYKLLELSFQAPEYGGYTKYDTVNHEYAKYSYWGWVFAKSLKVEVWNLTDVDAELLMWDVQYFSRF
jgi:hypothetical protein